MLTQVTRNNKLERSIFKDGGEWQRGTFLGKSSHSSVHLAYFHNPNNSSRFKNFPQTVAVKSSPITCSKELRNEKTVYESLGNSHHILRYFGDDVTFSTPKSLALNVFLEFASRGSLFDAIAARPQGFGLLEPQAKRFAASILKGIVHIHEAGFTHGEIEPGNVLLVEESEGDDLVAKIANFGAAKRSDQEETIRGKSGDIWGLGCCVFSMLTGVLEWVGEPKIEEISEPRRKISEQGKDFVGKCLLRDPRERPTAVELLKHPFVCEFEYDEIEMFGLIQGQSCLCM